MALLLVKENVPPLVFMLGLYVTVKHNRKIGLLTLGLSVVWWSANLWWILPGLNGMGTLDDVKVLGGPLLSWQFSK